MSNQPVAGSSYLRLGNRPYVFFYIIVRRLVADGIAQCRFTCNGIAKLGRQFVCHVIALSILCIVFYVFL